MYKFTIQYIIKCILSAVYKFSTSYAYTSHATAKCWLHININV